MRVKRLLQVFRTRTENLFADLQLLDLRTAVQHRYDDIEYAYEGSTLLTRHQAASLLRQASQSLQVVLSSRCDVLKRITFPRLRVIDCSGSSSEDPLTSYVIESCPVLQEVRCGTMDVAALRSLPSGLRVLCIECLEAEAAPDESMRLISRLSRLRHLSLTADCVRLSNDFFADMRQLEVLDLTLFLLDPLEDDEGHLDEADAEAAVVGHEEQTFGDEGMRILLKNNHELKDVSLSGLNLTNQTLHLFADYVRQHACLQRLAIKSLSMLDEDVARELCQVGGRNHLQQLSILSDDPQEDLVFHMKRSGPDSDAEILVTRGAAAAGDSLGDANVAGSLHDDHCQALPDVASVQL